MKTIRNLTHPVAAVLVTAAAFAAVPERDPGTDRIGAAAPPFHLEQWLNTAPLTIEDLRGEVLLVRWWTDTCPFCSTTAPVLRELDRTYGDRGLRVIGIFHPKPPGDDSLDRLRRATARFEFGFPVGLDPDWAALRRWWLESGGPGWTSVSFLVDREGIIRYVHPGGEYHPGTGGHHWPDHTTCNREYTGIIDRIEALLAE
jgi:peroxiredoxin